VTLIERCRLTEEEIKPFRGGGWDHSDAPNIAEAQLGKALWGVVDWLDERVMYAREAQWWRHEIVLSDASTSLQIQLEFAGLKRPEGGKG